MIKIIHSGYNINEDILYNIFVDILIKEKEKDEEKNNRVSKGEYR